MHPLLALITILAVLQFTTLSFLVGRARGKYGVPAPQTDGPDGFRRAFRVQQNTLEQMVAFLPSLWLFAIYLDAVLTATILGAVWLVGRAWYAHAYVRGKNRFPGFLMNVLTTTALALGALWGIVAQLLAA